MDVGLYVAKQPHVDVVVRVKDLKELRYLKFLLWILWHVQPRGPQVQLKRFVALLAEQLLMI